MRNTLKIFLSLVGLPFLLAACGDDTNNNPTGGGGGSGGSGGGGTGPTIEELGGKVREAFCTGAVDCHRTETAAECLASTDIQIDAIAAAVEAGTVKYHPEKVDGCLAGLTANFACAFTQQTGDPGGESQAACEAVFEGTVADGGACSIDEACVSGHCEVTDPMCSMQCCASKCTPKAPAEVLAKVGESCVDVSCAPGGYCQFDMMGMPTTCAAQATEGQACTDFSGCKSPSVCDLDFMTGMGTCKVPAAHGAACNPDGIFACDRYDDYCDKTTKVCTTLKAPGDACMSDPDCVGYAFCNAMSKCEKQPVAGAACDDMNGPACLGDLDCTNSKCVLTPETICP